MSVSRLAGIAQMAVRACFAVLLVLGALFWAGQADAWRGVHVAAGILLVLGLWTIAGAAAARGAGTPVAAAAFIWGAVTVVLGLTQESVLPGSSHWVTQVAHLLVGVVAIGLAEMLGARLRRSARA